MLNPPCYPGRRGGRMTHLLRKLVLPTSPPSILKDAELSDEIRTKKPSDEICNKMPSNEIRSNLLVAAALIAAVTFQAGDAPPGGVWQDDNKNTNVSSTPAAAPSALQGNGGTGSHFAGQAIYSSQRVPFHFFLICNTLAFFSSTYLLLCLTFGYPYFLEVLVAAVSMAGTYAAAIFCVTPKETGKFRFISLVAVLPIVIRPLIWSLSWTIGTIRRRFRELGDEVPTADQKVETELT